MELKDLFKKTTLPTKKNELRKRMKEETISVHDIFNQKEVSLADRIQRCITQEQLYSIITNNYCNIIDLLCTDIKFYKTLINNKNFLSSLIVITNNTVTNLSKEYIIKINGICRRYICYDAIKSSDDSIKDLIYLLSKVSCSGKYNRLRELGLSEQITSDIILYSCSNEDEIISVRQLNLLLVATMQNNLFTTQNIIKIYETLFTSMKSIFLAVMLDKSPRESLIPKQEIQDNIIKATLALLESLDINRIYYILKDYFAIYDAREKMNNEKIGKINLGDLNKNIYKNINEAYAIILQENS